MQLANSIPWKLPSSPEALWENFFGRTFQFELYSIETLLWYEGFVRFTRSLTSDMLRDTTEVMNFMVNKLDYVAEAPVPLGRFLAEKATFGMAVFILAVEFAILWQLVRPLELIVTNPTEQARAQIDREGLLKRF